MNILDSLHEYELIMASDSDQDNAFMVLSSVLLEDNPNDHPSIKERSVRVLNNNIRLAIRENRCLIVMSGVIPIGCAIINDRDKNFIEHINILEDYRSTLGTLLLNNYIINEIFKDEKLYIDSDDTETFKSITDEEVIELAVRTRKQISLNQYEKTIYYIKDSVKNSIEKMYLRYKES